MNELTGTDLEATSIARLTKRLERERRARLEAEAISERSIRQLYQRTEEIQLISRIASVANETADLEHIFREALTAISRFAECAQARAFIYDRESGELKELHIGQIEGDRTEFSDTPLTHSLTIGVGLPSMVMEQKRPVWIGDLSKDPNVLQSPEVAASGFKSGFAFPVMIGSNVEAVLEFFSLTERDSDPNLLEILSQAGLQLGRALERKHSEEKLLYEARHDPLTNLANRRGFHEHLIEAMKPCTGLPGSYIGVLFIDLDRFKLINDSLGHQAGDELLIGAAKRIMSVLASSTFGISHRLARLGGDEFTLLLEGLRDVEHALELAEHIRHELAKPYHLRSQSVYSAASLGLAICRAGDQVDLMRNADLALYRAKMNGRARIEVYEETMHAEAVKRLWLETDLRAALSAGEFFINYQPIYHLPTRNLSGFEALIRWRRDGVLVGPDEFIPLCEDTGFIVFIGEWVLGQVCRDVKTLQETHPGTTQFTVSLNVSPKQFIQPTFVEDTLRTIRASGVDPSLLCLEVTEAVTVLDFQRAKAVFGEFRKTGLKIAIDDFGTGYSSLNYLRQLPIDILKVDRSFIADINTDCNSHEVVEMILQLAKKLSLRVVAEGIEDGLSEKELLGLGCDYGQGYHFSRPIPLLQASKFLDQTSTLNCKL